MTRPRSAEPGRPPGPAPDFVRHLPLAAHIPFADGGGRYVSWENHDTCAKGLLATLAVIETEQLADRVTVVRRDGTVLYANELTCAGGWRRPSGRASDVEQKMAGIMIRDNINKAEIVINNPTGPCSHPLGAIRH